MCWPQNIDQTFYNVCLLMPKHVKIYPNKTNTWKHLYHKNMFEKRSYNNIQSFEHGSFPPESTSCTLPHSSPFIDGPRWIHFIIIIIIIFFFLYKKRKVSFTSLSIFFSFFSLQKPSDEILKPLCFTNDFMNYLCHLKDFLIREIKKVNVDLWKSWYWSWTYWAINFIYFHVFYLYPQLYA